MRSPDYYLKELLYEFDCVTIPGFGGFIMQPHPARIDRVKHRIHPPARYPSFNSLLNHDDGLLISRVSKSGNISYQEAGNTVREYSESLKKRIFRGESVILEGIGELKNSTEGILSFRPDQQVNFMAESFGMETLNLYPLSKPQQNIRTVKKPVDRTASDLRERKPTVVKWTLALSLPVILFLLYGIIFPSSIQNIYTNYSGIVFEIFRPEKISSPIQKEMTKIISLPVTVPTQEIISEPEPEAKTTPEVKTETLTAAAVPASAKYYIIGGCFEHESNAVKFLDHLLKKGYEAEKAGATKLGHIRISYKSFAQKEPALYYLQKIRDEENPSAWLLKY
jgi:nucleoid DNA-binding protein